MYMSQVEIDINNRQKIKDLTHLGAYHNWVEQSFPEEFSQNLRSRKLWRIDQLAGKHYLLIVSESKPSITRLERYGVENSGKTQPYDQFLESIHEGMKAKFKVTLNPVFSQYQSTSERGRVIPLISENDQMEYLLRRSEKNGFHLSAEDFVITNKGFKILKKSNQRALRLSSATYQGELVVSDADLFRKTLAEGIGKKKAFGFGLMTIIPEKIYE
ncbi:type I-E CRISPR-associated protein Cas6/Cse3/CasE [Aerococcaceae bacterium WGS1372]